MPRAFQVRSTLEGSGHRDVLKFQLSYRPPFDWPALILFLGKRAIEGVEHIDGKRYLRTVRIEHAGTTHSGWIAVAPAVRKSALKVEVSPALATAIPITLGRVQRLFDLTCDPAEITAALGPLAARNPGLRLPGAFDGFETAVRAILGQQITVKAARTLAGRFAAAFGTPIDTPSDALGMLFPCAERVAELRPGQIASLGIVSARSNAIIALARAVASDAIRLEPGTEVQSTLNKLRSLPGVGEWTAQYIAMRALAWPDAFPHTDYGVLKAMGETRARRALETAAQWRPWRAYAVMHLWNSLEKPKQ